MPELPEVEAVRRGLVDAVVGRTVVSVWADPASRRLHHETLPAAVGRTVEVLARRGKYLLARLDDAGELALHLGMTGSVRVVARGVTPEQMRHVRARVTFDDGSELVFNDPRRFGQLAVLPAGDRSALPTLAKLGVDPLTDVVDHAHVHAALARSTAVIKTVLLGQRVVAGVGNYIADEALWRARVAPQRRACDLSRDEVTALLEAVADIVTTSLAYGGSTFSDFRRADGTSGSYATELQVYGRGGEPCERCGQALSHGQVGGRTTVWCPGCQARP